ncbi:hypothetical protein NXO50_001921 [Enterococcus hirae]|nr:hypothetical protein [Enterococcus hirae]EMF0192519.1 hypothetical protein [Enterococcus hirae]EMF0240422.1 hypothetical protein [Enterococcus hirae]EMF0245194.1 hypothetical protein [Enterococcus hirae]
MAERKIAKSNRGFKGIWIPASYWLDENLTIQEMLFLAEIDSLDIDEKGCYASNKHFSDFFGLTAGRCSQIITSLKDKGYICRCGGIGRRTSPSEGYQSRAELSSN